jgi:hypothetical protein
MKITTALLLTLSFLVAVSAQTKTTVKPAAAKTSSGKLPAAIPAKPSLERGSVAGQTYTNRAFGFLVIFPDTWFIPGDDFEADMKKAGFDLSLRAPTTVGAAGRTRIERALKGVTVALTAYRSMPGSADNAIVRISFEDLKPNPQIKDAIDYFDAMRAQYRAMTLPADFKYSETQAEQLGRWQFAFLDSSSKAGKKRLYATVRKGYAILFSLSYTNDEDLQTLRKVLKDGNFSLK